MLDFFVDLLLYKVLLFLVALSILVFVHEFGHYYAARRCGVRVLAFSIGFGPEIFGFEDRQGTRWKFCWIPLGGYVRMYGDLNAASAVDPAIVNASPAQKAEAFPFKPLWQKAAIVFAGPLANFIFSFVVLSLLYVGFGTRVTPPNVGYIAPGSPATVAGFEVGDHLLSFDDKKIDRMEDFLALEMQALEQPAQIRVERQGEVVTLVATPDRVKEFTSDCRSFEANDLGLRPTFPPLIRGVVPDGPAAHAGLTAGDLIRSVDGQSLGHFLPLVEILQASPGKNLRLGVERDGRVFEVDLRPAAKRLCNAQGVEAERGQIGASFQPPITIQSLGFLAAMEEATIEIYGFIKGTLNFIGQIITGQRGTEDLSGPIGIADVTGEAAKSSLFLLIWLAAILSLNLGLINLFPIPVLDGGHLLLYAIEAVRGKPLGLVAQERLFRFGMMLIFALMLFLFWNDIMRLVKA